MDLDLLRFCIKPISPFYKWVTYAFILWFRIAFRQQSLVVIPTQFVFISLLWSNQPSNKRQVWPNWLELKTGVCELMEAKTRILMLYFFEKIKLKLTFTKRVLQTGFTNSNKLCANFDTLSLNVLAYDVNSKHPKC